MRLIVEVVEYLPPTEAQGCQHIEQQNEKRRQTAYLASGAAAPGEVKHCIARLVVR